MKKLSESILKRIESVNTNSRETNDEIKLSAKQRGKRRAQEDQAGGKTQRKKVRV